MAKKTKRQHYLSDKDILLEHGISEGARTVYIDKDIDEDMATRVMKAFDLLAEGNQKKEINIVINSLGGDIYSGLAIIDAIEGMKKKKIKVITKAYGAAMSMAAWILVVGSKRLASKNSQIMIHEGIYGIEGKWHDVKVDMRHSHVLEERCWEILAKYTKVSKSKWKAMCQKGDLYLDVEQAKELNVIDEIID